MDLNEIKKIIEAEGGKFIIIENGKPVMVITSFKEYQNRIFQETPLQVKVEKESKKISSPPQELKEEEELKIEDLPF